MARAFLERGDDVQIFTFKLQYPKILFPGKTQYTSEAKPQDLSINIKINSINPFNWIRVGRSIRKIQPSLVIVSWWLPFMGPCFGTILRVLKHKETKIVTIAHNIIPHEKKIGDRLFTRYFVRPINRFVVMSRSVQDEIKQFLKPKQEVRFCPHPIYDTYGEAISKSVARVFILKFCNGASVALA